MAEPRIAPTQSNLLRQRDQLQIARQGHDVLDEKRQALILEVMTMIEDAEAARRRMREEFAAAYRALVAARMSLGSEKLEWIALSAVAQPEVGISQQRVMGVAVPVVHAAEETSSLQYGLGGTSVALDEAVRRFRELLSTVYQMAELMTAIWRLTAEIRRTQRRVKALENISIPQLESNVKFIEDAIEEKELEEYFRVKLIKKKLTGDRL